LTVKLAVPVVVGLPEISSVEGGRVRPSGREPPDNDQVRGAMPPLAASMAEYEEPTVPSGSEEVVIDTLTVPEAKVIDRSLVAVSGGVVESVTLTVKLAVPGGAVWLRSTRVVTTVVEGEVRFSLRILKKTLLLAEMNEGPARLSLITVSGPVPSR
jgi:hypothetical protein